MPDLAQLGLYIFLLPLMGAVLLLFVGRRLDQFAGVLASSAVGLSFLLALMGWTRLLGQPAHGEGENLRSASIRVLDWIHVGRFDFGFDLLVDQLSIVMVLVVTGVGTLIHVYSIAYMAKDPRYHRYFAYLNLFVASMLLLVLADNLLLLYVGWEGVGLCSYLLIGFWFEKRPAHNAAKKAFIVNRIGDFAFLLGIFVLAGAVGSLTVGEINEAAGAMTAGIATIAGLLLFAGATGKSAQIPLYVWLPDAMEGPTPVSALIHAATMVTAGVYVVARFSPVFDQSEGALAVIGWIGALTALWAALMAAFEYDIKRVLAYSTISQLGYMFLAHGVGAYSVGIFHLVTHAFFKALMFLGAGAVMHALAGEVDMRRMGGLRKVLPVTGTTFAAGWLAICGLIPFSGFFSKDAILASAWANGDYALWTIGVATAFLTAYYMSRLYFRVFEGDPVVPDDAHPHDAPPAMAGPLIALAGAAVIGGLINLPGALTLEHFLEPVLGESHVPAGLTPWVLAGVALLVAAGGILVARSLYLLPGGEQRRARLYSIAPVLVEAARAKFYVDDIYGALVVRPAKALARAITDFFDVRVVDRGITGLGRVVAGASEVLRGLQTGYVRNYALAFLFGVVLLFSFVAVRVVT
ncbi:MAG TPA: NADH-quinone oxidoreductase subunit L [Actinomycetota bacterium]|nr:NADH-quinone oxidoreductase subunit L [Actinomycetota bacterium]